MDADESFSIVVDEGEEVCLLLHVHLEIATCEEEDRVKVGQVFCVVFELFLCEGFGVGSNGRIPQPDLLSESFDRGHGMRDRFVSVSLFFANNKQVLSRSCASLTEAIEGEHCKENQQASVDSLHRAISPGAKYFGASKRDLRRTRGSSTLFSICEFLM